MAVDPYVPTMIEDAPRGREQLPPPHGWRGGRPGDLAASQPVGKLLGSPGPDAGYAWSLVEGLRDAVVLTPNEHLDDALALGVAVGMRRAARFGRAPVRGDLEVGLGLLGYLGDAPDELVTWRKELGRGAAHEYAAERAVTDAIRDDALRLTPPQARKAASAWRGMLVESQA